MSSTDFSPGTLASDCTDDKDGCNSGLVCALYIADD